MNGDPTVETVLPRPVTPLPQPALAVATRKLTDKLVEQFNMSEAGAQAFALAVVDPSNARKAAENPERLSVPGGVIVAIRTDVWSRYVMPDPRNPRIGPARRHPVSDLVGRGGESTRLRPLGEPKAAAGGRPELVQRIQSQEHLAWAAQQAREYIVSNNDWRSSIRHQGVMTEVWLAATTFDHLDDNPSVTIPVTAEGSSRMTCVHDLLGLRSADIPYDRDERRMRAHIRKLNEEIAAAGSPDQVDKDLAVRARCETVPALLLVGFESHGDIAADFGVAVKSLVALRHVDYPKPWGAATENEALADAVIDELQRRDLVTAGKADWLSGVLTPEEAQAAGFSADPTVRTAAIVRLFTDHDPRTHQAVRVAITSQSTRKNTSPKLLFELATSLVLRSVPEEDARLRERIRKYLAEAFSNELAKEDWEATFRDSEELAEAALTEVGAGRPGPATRELAARGAYALVVRRQLQDRGPRDVEPEDRRKPGEVINRMRSAAQGVYQLRQALVDLRNGRPVRLVDDAGQVERNAEGREVVARNADLRNRFRAPGEGPGLVPAPETPAEVLGNALTALGGSIREVEMAVKKVEAVQAEDGTSAIDSLGASKADCDEWQKILFEVFQKLPIWSNRSIQRHGAPAPDEFAVDDLDADDDDLDDDVDGDDPDPDVE
ncbi:hypothetical protein EV385_6602 [Krasilnikovia cinnamomea]|uniref:Uncharacterized protein n=1 Tax=Krasilnikovia cinnamomea TaxID=349313 RepID=A0A4Q7Z7W5_9ACTN|nr:hypothetical protein [Krasilnikovia cinnamomea]RZU46528.1 hypothetical protein EV385_6602 [Krasilnikovia cinnamomea]